MTWNWQLPNWPEFTWRKSPLSGVEGQFLLNGGVVIGRLDALAEVDGSQVALEILVNEAFTTSEIEGEYLNRASVQSSIQRQLGLGGRRGRVPAAEQGISEMMVDLYSRGLEAANPQTLFRWHEMICRGQSELEVVGGYRKHAPPMQIVSGRMDKPKVHFEAPPSSLVAAEMKRFFGWLSDTAPGGRSPLPPVTRAGVAHLYFESIHPFEDGNGRIGRALSEQILMTGIGRNGVIGISSTIQARLKEYYQLLEDSSRSLDIHEWLIWFGARVIEAQQSTQTLVGFVLAKTHFLNRFDGLLNERQHKVVLRLFAAGPAGFEGGLSASNYIRMTHASTATATRDLRALVQMGALIKEGERRHTRYLLNLDNDAGG
jgi:Fic family protein